MPDFQRKRNRLPPTRYRGLGSFFVTICCYERKKLFEKTDLTEQMLAILKETSSARSFRIYAYCFMLDHLHLLVQGTHDSANLPEMVRAFKGASSVAARQAGLSRLWQRGFYDHVIRSYESLDRIAWYVLMNPVRANLAGRARDWRFSDSVIPNWNNVEEPAESYDPPWKKAVVG